MLDARSTPFLSISLPSRLESGADLYFDSGCPYRPRQRCCPSLSQRQLSNACPRAPAFAKLNAPSSCARSSTMDRTPSIRIHSHCLDNRCQSPPSHSRHSPQHSLHAPASPMSIPHAAQDSPSVPPPLPPPTHLYEDLTPQAQQKEWNFFNKEYLDQHWTDFGKPATVRPGSSLLGGNKSHSADHGGEHSQHHEPDASRRGSSMSTVTVPHRNSEAMIDPCDSDEAKPGYRCVILPFSSLRVKSIA
jgi:hypothetical protein